MSREAEQSGKFEVKVGEEKVEKQAVFRKINLPAYEKITVLYHN